MTGPVEFSDSDGEQREDEEEEGAGAGAGAAEGGGGHEEEEGGGGKEEEVAGQGNRSEQEVASVAAAGTAPAASAPANRGRTKKIGKWGKYSDARLVSSTLRLVALILGDRGAEDAHDQQRLQGGHRCGVHGGSLTS